MTPAFVVQITTPKKYILNGLWFGAKKPKRIVIWVHGLGSSMFSKLRIVELLAKGDTAVLAFNNRGHDTISHLVRLDGKLGAWAGAAHEKFTDSADDIQGAIDFVKRSGAKRIFLVGHSTGCQKSIYWASKLGKGVRGIVLLAPVSDYAAAVHFSDTKKLASVTNYARELIRKGRGTELLPSSKWQGTVDAQRFLSLNTPDSIEEIFTYAQPKKTPQMLRKVRIPILALWAEDDEFADRPASEVLQWFQKNLKKTDKVSIVPNVGHSFRDGEKAVGKAVAEFMKER